MSFFFIITRLMSLLVNISSSGIIRPVSILRLLKLKSIYTISFLYLLFTLRISYRLTSLGCVFNFQVFNAANFVFEFSFQIIRIKRYCRRNPCLVFHFVLCFVNDHQSTYIRCNYSSKCEHHKNI